MEDLTAEQIAPTSIADVQEAIARAQVLMKEVERMQVRLAVGTEEIAHIPPEAHQYYGKLAENLKEINDLEEKYGFQTFAVPPDWADRLANNFLTLSSDDYEPEEKPKQDVKQALEVAEEFAELAAAPSTAYGVPEQLLAGYIDEQIRAGNNNINLTQSYLTDSPDEADARHTLALHNLLPLIEVAQMSGITFEAGEAQLASEKLQEIIAIRNTETIDESRFSVGV
jgi:hypothetical protein